MTDHTDAEVEALCTALLSARWHHGGCTTQSNMQRKIIAVSLLDSDWLRDLLAAREAAARAEALREAATWVIGCEHVTAMRWCGICDEWRARLEEEAGRIACTDGAGW